MCIWLWGSSIQVWWKARCQWRIPGLWWGAQYWWLKVDQMVGCGTLCWQWLLSDNDYICCWGRCSVKSQWSLDWLGDHSDWFIIVPCCSLNILNITPNCIIMKSDFRMLASFYILIMKRASKRSLIFFVASRTVLLWISKAFIHLCFLQFPKKYNFFVKNTLNYLYLLAA